MDDGSRDGTARLAAELGARVVRGAPLPDGWVGKQWALRQGVAAARGAIVVTLDADTRPAPGLFAALAAALEAGTDLVSAGPRFVCDGPVEQALHAAFLATLVYRFGPIGPAVPPPPHRIVANGQCLAFRRGRCSPTTGSPGCGTGSPTTWRWPGASPRAAGGWRSSTRAGCSRWTCTTRRPSCGGNGAGRCRCATSPRRSAGRRPGRGWLAAALPVLRLAAGRPTRLDLALLAARCC